MSFFIVLALVALTLVLIACWRWPPASPAAEYLGVLWLLGFFFLRVFYFTAFEMTPRAATPGKRILGMRVARARRRRADRRRDVRAQRDARAGGLPAAVLPAAQAAPVDAWISLWASSGAACSCCSRCSTATACASATSWRAPGWCARPSGCWAPICRRAPARGARLHRGQLDAYGIKELSVLEDVLRRKDAADHGSGGRRASAPRSAATDRMPDRADFLAAYYTALRGAAGDAAAVRPPQARQVRSRLS